MVYSQPINLISCCLNSSVSDKLYKMQSLSLKDAENAVLISFLKQEIEHVSDKKSPRDTKTKWLPRKNVYRDRLRYSVYKVACLVCRLVINCMPSISELFKNWKAWLNENVYMFVLSTPFVFLFSLVINLRKKEMSASCFNLLRGTLTQLTVQWVVNRVSPR